MDRPKDNKKITAIVPAYNEADRIAPVLEILVSYEGFDEIIVIDDGSTDKTGEVAGRFNVRYIRNESNIGKGKSMDRAVALAQNDIIFFCDADISGLTRQVIDEIVTPVLEGKADMFIGMRNRKWYFAHQIVSFIPLLGGERALTRQLWGKLPDYYKQYFRIEAALNFFSLYYGQGFQYKVFKGLAQVIKEKKYGFWAGQKQRWKMISNILGAQLRLNFVHIPDSAKNRRRMALISLQSVLGMVVGVLFLTAVYFGPRNFIIAIFSHDLATETATPFINFLLRFTDITTTGTIMAIGIFILAASFSTFLFTFKNLWYLLYGLLYKIKNNKT